MQGMKKKNKITKKNVEKATLLLTHILEYQLIMNEVGQASGF